MASLRGNVMERLDGRDSSVCRYTLLMERPHIQVTFRGAVLYQTQSGHSHTLLFSGHLSTADFIRHDLHTPEQCFTWSEPSLDGPRLPSGIRTDLSVNRLSERVCRKCGILENHVNSFVSKPCSWVCVNLHRRRLTRIHPTRSTSNHRVLHELQRFYVWNILSSLNSFFFFFKLHLGNLFTYLSYHLLYISKFFGVSIKTASLPWFTRSGYHLVTKSTIENIIWKPVVLYYWD